ncbi:MAG: ADP-ribosylglycohydrolase family protein [Ignavibacteriales bacterium]|nr:ADP-ribosylglycohydrolase family protein [Ignavibacteriales bacterium]
MGSTQAAIHNLRKGILPPQSGKENPHYFDDGAMARAVPIGIICAGEPEKAARMVEIDASVTNSEDGVWAAQAIAVALSMLCTGTNIDEAISSADQYLPKSSWIRRVVEEARKISEKSDTLFSILPDLQKGIVNREYSYGNVAPETLALAFVIVRLSSNNFGNAVTAACGFAKSGMTMPSIVGALMGGMQSTPFASESWLSVIKTLKGISIPSFAGKDYLSLVEQISNLAGEKVVQ